MSEAMAKLVWLVPTTFLVGFIYAAVRCSSFRGFLRQGWRQSLSILLGMSALGLVIYWISRHL